MDFDDLKRAWDDHDRQLASGIRLNAPGVRSLVMRDEAARANPPGDRAIDYTMPVALAQGQLDTYRIIRIVRSAAVLIRDRGRADQLVAQFQAIVTRLLGGRHRTLGG